MAVGRRLTPDLTLPVFVSVSGDGQDSALDGDVPQPQPFVQSLTPLSLLLSAPVTGPLRLRDREAGSKQPVLTVTADRARLRKTLTKLC